MRLFKKDYDKTYFDTALDSTLYKKYDARRKVELINSIKSSGRLLEIGCGKGVLLNALKKDYSVYGYDISLSAIESAKKLIGENGRDDKILRVLNIEYENIIGKFDIILAFDVLEHLKEPEKILIKIKNSLKKEGVLIFTVPNNYGLYGKIMTLFFNLIDKTHISAYPRKKWIDISEKVGFTLDIRNDGLFGIVKSWIGKYISYNLLVVAKR